MNHGSQEEKLLKNENSGEIVHTNDSKIKSYGYELIMDLHGCDVSKFTREDLCIFFDELCNLIEMEKRDLHFWDDIDTPVDEQQTSPHTKGTSAVQFILTSSIVIHTLDIKGDVYINIFSCKYFDEKIALEFCNNWFSSSDCISHYIERV